MKGEEKDNGGRAQVNIRRNCLSAELAGNGESQGATGLQVLSRMGMNQQKKSTAGAGKAVGALPASSLSLTGSIHVKLSHRDIQEPSGSVRQGRNTGIGWARRLPICHGCCHFMTGDEAGAGEAKRGARTGSPPRRRRHAPRLELYLTDHSCVYKQLRVVW